MQLLGVGRDADVFALDGGRVLRRYRDPQRSAEREARVMAHARAAGLPVPEVFDVDGADLVLQRIEGPTMAAALVRRPWTLAAQARVLAGLHRAVHEVPAPEWLPGVGDLGGTALLHLDLHPENVLLAAGGPVVIDWTNAARGPAGADVADAWLVMSVGSVPGGRLQAAVVGGRAGHLRPVVPPGGRAGPDRRPAGGRGPSARRSQPGRPRTGAHPPPRGPGVSAASLLPGRIWAPPVTPGPP
ncbi:Phosphotransferase enzyme family protein [Blastococcus aggregatus]|uniref:Phosphotransferase enzyme family protein n=1 Tax=Blastococcus aggregatus TaxID=38502 RepID=A0A285VHG3_9ACTN|nr:phosphotransferase [Blastococcus aggregatus]SOC51971.1 Phosphotransferase enzyme family protein [Blastococcus aggregatus]